MNKGPILEEMATCSELSSEELPEHAYIMRQDSAMLCICKTQPRVFTTHLVFHQAFGLLVDIKHRQRHHNLTCETYPFL